MKVAAKVMPRVRSLYRTLHKPLYPLGHIPESYADLKEGIQTCDVVNDNFVGRMTDYLRNHLLTEQLMEANREGSESIQSEEITDLFIREQLMKPSRITSEALNALGISNFEERGDNQFSGGTLYHKSSDCFKTLIDAGVETVIDFDEIGGYEKVCKDNGIKNFVSFQISEKGFWTKDVFKKEDQVIRCEVEDAKTSWGKTWPDSDILQEVQTKYQRDTREFIDDFIALMKVVRGRHYYAGCSYGTERTKIGFRLISRFDPTNTTIYEGALPQELVAMRNLADKFTAKDKRDLGWTEESENEFYENIREELRGFRYEEE